MWIWRKKNYSSQKYFFFIYPKNTLFINFFHMLLAYTVIEGFYLSNF